MQDHPDCLLCDYVSPEFSAVEIEIPLSGNVLLIPTKAPIYLQTDGIPCDLPYLRGPPSLS